jgi:hypothetical protein
MLGRLATAGCVIVWAQFALVVAAIIYLGFHLFPVVFGLSPRPLAVQINASCRGADAQTSCNVSTFELTLGRYRVSTDVPASSVTVFVTSRTAMDKANILLVKVSEPMEGLELTRLRSDGTIDVAVRIKNAGVRTLTPLPAASATISELAFASDAGGPPARVVIDEIGFYESADGLLNDMRAIFPSVPAELYYSIIVPRSVLPFCIFTAVAAFFVPTSMLRRIGPPLLALICFAFCLLDLMVLYSPYGGGDLQSFYVAGPLQEPAGNNLNEGVWLAWRFLQGQGLTIPPGVVPWERMPGYGLFCVVAGLLFGHGSLLELTVATVLLQIILYCVAVGVFSAAAMLLWSPAAVWSLSMLLALLPKQLGFAQVDSIIAPIAILLLAALCFRWRHTDADRPGRWGVDVVVHLTFALWFVMRPDVLPGWLLVSTILHWRNWKRLLIPAAFILAIGVSWGLYKTKFTHEFSPTTSSVGAALICGLWEVPSRFASSCTDEAYFAWVREHTSLQPKTQAASNFATRETVRFWLTFPGHFIIMLNHKMMKGLDGDFWPGYRTDLQRGTDTQRIASRVLRRPVATLALLTTIALCLAVGYHRCRTLVLAWPIYFNAPFFWLTFSSSGRFYSAVSVALLVAGVPPLLDRTFYTSVIQRPWRSAAVVASMVLFAAVAWPFHQWLLQNESFHYWTPLLSPDKSLLTTFK